nr:ATP synthase F0 subunit 8 [Aquatica wuhana]
MPQMAPLSWLNLFIYYTMVFMMFNTMNYFFVFYKINKNKTTNKSYIISWKW